MRFAETKGQVHGAVRALADRKSVRLSDDTKGLQHFWLRRRHLVGADAAVVIARRVRKAAEARK